MNLNKLQINEDTQILIDFIRIWSNEKNNTISSFNDLKNTGIHGFLKLELLPIKCKKKLDIFKIEEEEYYIKSGVFIMPQAKCLFEQDFKIDGFLLDTTWRVLANYVTCFLTACFYNASIPFAFGFGHGETKILYDFLLKTVSSKLNIKFNKTVFESDQGPALVSICQEYGINHLFCLRHLIHGLKNSYKYEITVLVKCVSQFDFQNCCEVFSKSFKKRCDEDPNQFTIINRRLKKIGLTFIIQDDNGKIEIKNESKWEQMSMSRRVKYHMPSTTNSLEATHGHLNSITPRRSNLYSAIYRIHNEINSKFLNINQKIQHNYNNIKRLTKEKVTKINPFTLEKMCEFYKTTQKNCLCSENKLISANLKIDVPCSHRISKGETFLEFQKINLNLTYQFDQLEEIHDILQPEEIIQNETTDEINFIIKSIQFFSKYRKENDIKSFVEEHYTANNGFFINNQKVSVIQLIEDGIFHFQELKKENAKEKEKIKIKNKIIK